MPSRKVIIWMCPECPSTRVLEGNNRLETEELIDDRPKHEVYQALKTEPQPPTPKKTCTECGEPMICEQVLERAEGLPDFGDLKPEMAEN